MTPSLQTFVGSDADFLCGVQEDVRFWFAGEGAVIEDDFVRIEPAIEREGFEIESDIFFDRRSGADETLEEMQI